MANFFNNVIAPQLNSTEYGQGIQDMVNTINDNFQKVFTLPFLQGDDGDMISTEFCPFWEKVYNSNDEIEVDNCLLTQEGVKIYNTIFETTLFEENMEYEDFKKVLINDLKLYSIGNSYNDISLFTNLYGPHKDPKILLFYKISSEDGVSETPLSSAQLYYYFDPRINKLSELITINNDDKDAENYRQSFRDYTCILSTKYDSDGNYTYEKQSGWPTLYFDNSSKQYCWVINGQQTGINAQGVNGKDGIGARIWVCQVELDTNNSSQVNYENGIMSQFIMTKVFVPKDYQWYTKILDNGVWNGKWLSEDNKEVDLKSYLGETNYFQQGDMAVCYLPNTENKYSDQMIGVINQNSDDKTFFVQASISQNTTNTFKNLSLFNLLSSIGTGENDTPTMKGIFIPTTVGNNTSAHTLYEGDFNGQNPGLYLVKTDDYNNIKFNGGLIVSDNKNIDFNVYYNTNIYGKLNVYDTTTLNSDLILNSNVDSDGKYYSNTIIFQRGGSSDVNYDWYMYGNTDGELDLGYKGTGKKHSILKLGKIRTVDYVNIYGDTTLNRKLTVTDITKLDGGLIVGTEDKPKSTTLNGTLKVTGATTLNSGLTVTGETTLTNNSREVLKIKTSASTNDPYIQFLDKTDDSFRGGVGILSSNGLFLQYNNDDTNETVLYLNNKQFYPKVNYKYSLGTEDQKWSNVFAKTFQGDLKGGIYLTNDDSTDEEHFMVFATRKSILLPHSLYTDSDNLKYNPHKNILTVEKLNITDSITSGATVHGNITTDAIELSAADPYIDFKADYTRLDYSSRIISWKDTPSNLDIISPYGEVRLNPFNFMVESGKKTAKINNCTTIQANHTGEELVEKDGEKDGDSLKGYWPFLRVQFGGTGKSMLLVVKPQKDKGDFKVGNLIDIKGYVVNDDTIQPSNKTVKESDRDKNQSSSTEVNVWKPDTEIFDNNWFINNGFTVDGTVTKPDWVK